MKGQASFQLDIFGDMTPVEEAYDTKQKETLKMRFRKIHGYDETHQCRDCIYLCKYHAGTRNVCKCNWMGITASEATDIRESDPACDKWEGRNESA